MAAGAAPGRMPYRTFGADEVARYLHLSRADLDRLVKDQDIPFEKHGERLVFRKVEIDAWASQRILGLEGRPLAEYHQKSSKDARQTLTREAIMPDMIRPEFIDPALPAKTKASVLREMAALAEKTGRVCDPVALRQGLDGAGRALLDRHPGRTGAAPRARSRSLPLRILFPRPGPHHPANPLWRAGRPAHQPVLPHRLPRRPHAPAHPGPPVPDGAKDRHAGGAAPGR